MIEAGASKIKQWRENPALFVHELFQVNPDAWQADALSRLGGPLKARRLLGMKACTGPGKSTVLSWAGWHRLLCFCDKGEHPKGAALSGEGKDNLRDNLWAEMAKWRARSPLLMETFEWTKELIYAKEAPATWFLSARSYAKDADPEAIGRSLSGLHSKFPFILLDETGDMPITVEQKAKQIFTGLPTDALIMAAGNPTSTKGLLYHICVNAREEWGEPITVTADPDDPKRTPRVDIEHARQQIEKYGRDNPWVMATILGQFPPSGFNALLTIDEVEAAMKRHLQLDQYSFSQKRIGVDVARFGDDRTVLFPRQGLAAMKPVEMRNARTNEIAARVMLAKTKWDWEMAMVDGTGGYGAGVIDCMVQAGHSPLEVQFGGKPIDQRYFNKRTEMWFEMANWIKRGGALPMHHGMVQELTQPSYSFQNGKMRLEEKEQIKKRLLFSPDMGDALALTFAIPDMPGWVPGVPDSLQPGRQVGKTVTEYDPFAPDRA